jgi:hypothetical protein
MAKSSSSRVSGKCIVLFHRKKSGLSRNQLADLAGIGKTVIKERLDKLSNFLASQNLFYNLMLYSVRLRIGTVP